MNAIYWVQEQEKFPLRLVAIYRDTRRLSKGMDVTFKHVRHAVNGILGGYSGVDRFVSFCNFALLYFVQYRAPILSEVI